MNTNIDNKASRSTLMDRLEVDGAAIEYLVQGEGEPVLLIPPAGTIDGLGIPLLAQPQLAARYRLIHYHRRGYMGSSLGSDPLTIARQASDAAALLRHLRVKAAHIAGHSIGGIIALQLAVDAPDLVHSLVLLEPSLPMVPSGKAGLERLFLPIMNAYRAGDKRAAIETFCNSVFGPNWQAIVERAVPGGIEQAVRDADVTLQELPAIQRWQFGPVEAARISQPILSVLGAYSSQFMKEGRLLLHSWFPQAEDLDVPTTHLLQMQDPQAVTRGLAEFFARHPII
ncbi:MAG: alpha/beta fold hydrolase [Omnitrophica WOR_2 bacterium]